MATFDELLSRVRGTVREVDIYDTFERRRAISTYYWNHASNLHAGALVIEAARGPDFSIKPVDLGLGEGFAWGAALPPVFSLLAGISLELLLKAIAKILDLPESHTHDLNRLRKAVGIEVSADQAAILDALTEEVIWKSRYPVPKDREKWENSNKRFRSLRSEKKLGRFSISTHNPKRAVAGDTYEEIWQVFSECYWIAKSEVLEP